MGLQTGLTTQSYALTPCTCAVLCCVVSCCPCQSDVLDWHGDHPFTNFHDTLNELRGAGYYVEILHSPSTCFHPSNYGAYLVMDSEEEWYP